jgi:hypothetical protein
VRKSAAGMPAATVGNSRYLYATLFVVPVGKRRL